MKLTDRIVNGYNQLTRESGKKRAKYYNQDLNGDEESLTYMSRPAFQSINSQRSVFDQVDETSINTAKSVFDRTAIFHTKSDISNE